MMGFPPGPFFSTGGAGEPPAFLRALFDGVRRNVRDANRGGARQAPPLGFPGGMLPFQVVIGGGGPANLPPFPGAPGGIAMEDDDFVDVPSPREPPARRRRRPSSSSSCPSFPPLVVRYVRANVPHRYVTCLARP